MISRFSCFQTLSWLINLILVWNGFISQPKSLITGNVVVTYWSDHNQVQQRFASVFIGDSVLLVKAPIICYNQYKLGAGYWLWRHLTPDCGNRDWMMKMRNCRWTPWARHFAQSHFQLQLNFSRQVEAQPLTGVSSSSTSEEELSRVSQEFPAASKGRGSQPTAFTLSVLVWMRLQTVDRAQTQNMLDWGLSQTLGQTCLRLFH